MSTVDDFTDVAAAADAQARAYTAQAQALSAQQTAAISSIAGTWPQLDPGVVLPLGQAGLSGDDPTVQQAAASSAKQKASKGLLSRIGSDIAAVTIKPAKAAAGAVARNVFDPVKNSIPSTVGNSIYHYTVAPAKGISRVATALLNIPVETVQGEFRNEYNDLTSGNLVGLAKTAAMGGLAPGTPQVDQTTLGQYVKYGLTHGGHEAVGSGWFINPNSPVGQAQAAAARAAAPTIDGHALTIGRATVAGLGTTAHYLGVNVLEPGTEQYNILSGLIDGGVSLEAGKGAGSVGEEGRATKVLGGEPTEVVEDESGKFVPADQAPPSKVARTSVSYALNAKGAPTKIGESYGLVNGLRKTILPAQAVTWLNSAAGDRFAQFAADSKSFNTIWLATGKQLPVDLVTKLVDTDTSQDVKRLLAGNLDQTVTADPGSPAGLIRTTTGGTPGLLGTSLRTPPTVSAGMAAQAARSPLSVIQQAGLKVRRISQSPLLATMPGAHLDLGDPDGAVKDFDNWQRIAKLPEATISKNNEALARALTTGGGGPGAAYEAVNHAMTAVQQALQVRGVSATSARRMTSIWSNTIQDLRHYNVDDIGQNVQFPGVKIGDDGLPAPSPHLFVEYLNNHIPLPKIRDIRTAASRMAQITNSAPARLVQQAADVISNDLFKPLTLLRAAWPLRVIGEEQARLAAAGYASAFNHPINYLSMLVGSNDGGARTGYVISQLRQAGKSTLSSDALGEAWRNEADAALSADADDYAKAMSRRAAGYIDPSNGLVTRHYPIFTKGVDADFTKAWASELKMLASDPVASRIGQAMTEAGPGVPAIPQALSRITDWLWDGAGQKVRRDLGARWAARQVQNFQPANANPFLNKDQLGDWVNSIYNRVVTKTGGHPQLVDAVANGRVMGEPLTKGLDINPKAADALEQFVDYAPQKVTGPLRVYGNNSPGSQLGARYQAAVASMFDSLMSKPSNTLSRSPVFRQAYWQRMQELAPYLDEQSAATAAKNAAKAGARDAEQALRSGGAGALPLHDADDLAKKHALDQVQTLLYGASKRSSFFDAFRAIFPFGDAWREVLTRWAKLAAQNPAVPYRAMQISNAAHQTGFLHTDPQTGQEVFTYPGSQMLTQLLTGVPVPLEGSASGLNMVTSSMLPGFGPVVQTPVGCLLPDTGTTERIRNIILPYGEGDTTGGPLTQAELDLMPAYARKLITAAGGWTPQEKRQLMATTNQVADYLYSTGKYDISTPNGQQKLLSDARSKARDVWLIRGLAQFGAPSTPTPVMMAQDKNGRLTTLYALQTAYRSIEAKDPANATADFMAQYGPLALAATNPTTEGQFSPTDSLYDFAKANPDLVKKYPTLYGYFAPAGGQFSNPEYDQQIASGERTAITQQQNLDITNERMATAIYNAAKTQVAGRTDQAATDWLRSIRDALTRQYPQFAATSNDTGSVDDQLARLEVAAGDPDVIRTEAGQALSIYMQARTMANQAAAKMGLASFASAQSAAPIRTWLQQVAAKLVARFPDFDTLWTQVLSKEMTADDTENGTPDVDATETR